MKNECIFVHSIESYREACKVFSEAGYIEKGKLTLPYSHNKYYGVDENGVFSVEPTPHGKILNEVAVTPTPAKKIAVTKRAPTPPPVVASTPERVEKPKIDRPVDKETFAKFEVDKVYNGDVFDLISIMPDRSIDLVIVDPPYGDGVGYGRKNKEIKNNEDESINYEFLDAIYSKMKDNTSLYLFSNHKFVNQIKAYALSTGYEYRMLCIMVKNNIGMGYGFRNQYEVCLVLEKGKAKYNLKTMSNVWKMKHVKHTDDSHPHQKDYDIIRNIILHSSNEGDLVFDGFMGSFSTAKSCHMEKRKFVGTELDKKWYDAGNQTLEDLRNQLTLF